VTLLAPKKRAFVAAFDERLRRVDEACAEATARPSERASHRLRTSTRRLEATLSLLPKRLRKRGPWADYLAGAKVLFKAHGLARDLDVLAARLAAYAECEALVTTIREERDRARADAQRVTASPPAPPPPLAPAALRGRALRSRLERRLPALRARLDRDLRVTLRRSSDDERAHDARKTAKQLRYVLEALDEGGFAEALQTLQALQDHLGVMHDATVARDRLRDERDPSLEGAIAGEERARLRQHDGIPEKWRAVRDALDALAG
jgi:CHAD domain-containing protein